MDKEVEGVIDGQVDTKDTPARYLAFLARVRPVLLPFTRYLAYSSDVGEGLRPVVNPRFVTALYGVSWSYVGLDVVNEGRRANMKAKENKSAEPKTVIALAMAQRAIFQATASMLFPALTIHSVVRYSAVVIARANIQGAARKWGPTVLGLSVVPALPFLFDEPVEHVVEKAFEYIGDAVLQDPASKKALEQDHPHIPEKEL